MDWGHTKVEANYPNREKKDVQLFDVKEFNKKNKTPLHYAAEKNSKEIGEILISKGADINAKDIIYQNIIILFLINGIKNK